MRLAEIVFWGSLALALYAYGLYPLLLWLMSRWARDPAAGNRADDAGPWPTVTLLITAHRDEHFIVERLQNAVALDYVPRRLQILVGCAGEEDLTGLLAHSFDKRQVEVVQFPTPRRGIRSGRLRSTSQRRYPRVFGRSHADAAGRGPPARAAFPQPGRRRRLRQTRRDRPDEQPLARPSLLEIRKPFSNAVSPDWAPFRKSAAEFARFAKDLFVPLCEKTAVDNNSIAMQVHRQGYRLLYDEWAVATAEASPVADESKRRGRMRTEALNGLGLLWPLVDLRRGNDLVHILAAQGRASTLPGISDRGLRQQRLSHRRPVLSSLLVVP